MPYAQARLQADPAMLGTILLCEDDGTGHLRGARQPGLWGVDNRFTCNSAKRVCLALDHTARCTHSPSDSASCTAVGKDTPRRRASVGAIWRMSILPRFLPASTPGPTTKKDAFISGWVLR